MKKVISISIDEEKIAYMKKVTKETDIPISRQVNRALDNYLKKKVIRLTNLKEVSE